MSALQLFGFALVLSPFVVITGVAVHDLGVRAAIEIWVLTIVTCAAIGGGIALLAGSGS